MLSSLADAFSLSSNIRSTYVDNSSISISQASTKPSSPSKSSQSNLTSLPKILKLISESSQVRFADSRVSFNSNKNINKIISDLQATLISGIDKIDFNKQMENCRVLGKEVNIILLCCFCVIFAYCHYIIQLCF